MSTGMKESGRAVSTERCEHPTAAPINRRDQQDDQRRSNRSRLGKGKNHVLGFVQRVAKKKNSKGRQKTPIKAKSPTHGPGTQEKRARRKRPGLGDGDVTAGRGESKERHRLKRQIGLLGGVQDP